MTTPAKPLTDIDPLVDDETFLGFVRARLGEEVALKIQLTYGGAILPLPKTPQPHMDFCQLVGFENAETIAIDYGYGDIWIKLGMTSRRARIEQACIDGRTITDIARSFGCCKRTVWKAKQRLRRQGRMS